MRARGRLALYAIDGTLSERKHRSNVYHSATRYRDPDGWPPRFFSGPGTSAPSAGAGIAGALFGTGSKRLIELVVDTIAKDRKRDLNLPIDLIGFSRGAAIANEVAWVLGTPAKIPDNVRSRGRDLQGRATRSLFDQASSSRPLPRYDAHDWGTADRNCHVRVMPSGPALRRLGPRLPAHRRGLPHETGVRRLQHG